MSRDSLRRSIALACRRLGRAPAFSVAAALTLMLGIGATTAVFGVVNAVLLRPLPYPDAERLVDLSHTLQVSGVTRVDQSDATFLYYARESKLLDDIGIYRVTGANLGGAGGATAADDASAERVRAGRVSASLFSVLGARALRGRTFYEAEDRRDARPVALLGEQLWQRKYGGDPSLVGRRIDVDGVPHEIVGIMPASFALPDERTDLWLPIGIDPANVASAAFDYRGIGRLKDGVSLGATQAELQRLLPLATEAYPGRLTRAAVEATRMRAEARPLRDVVVGNVGRVLWVVLGAVACVLLIACANVMNLFLVRAEGRQQELALRRALGAGSLSLAGEFLAEAFVLALVGAVLAVLLAMAAMGALRSIEGGIGIPRVAELGIDGTVLSVALGATLLATLLVSIVPALRSASHSVHGLFGESGRSVTAGRGRHRARHVLVMAQLALALVLLAGAGLMARSFARLRAQPLGFDAAGGYSLRVALPSSRYATGAASAQFVNRALDELRAVPGIEAAGAVTKLPLTSEARQDSAVFLEDRPLQPGQMPGIHQMVFATPGYFDAMRIPLLAGRAFERPDPARAPLEVIVSRAVAERYWPGGRAVGKRLRMSPFPNSAWYTVVGVAGDVRGSALDQPPDEIVYLPMVVALGAQSPPAANETRWTPRQIAFVARTSGDPATVAAGIERAVRSIDPSVPTYGSRMLTDLVGQAAARTTFTLTLLGIASLVALVLGAVGVYGVISYVVSLRTREIAVRLALGARPKEIRRMVSRQSLVVAAMGVVLGLVGAAAATRVLSALLFGVDPMDPLTLGAAAVLLLAVAAIASWIPARRAAGLDPALALRAE